MKKIVCTLFAVFYAMFLTVLIVEGASEIDQQFTAGTGSFAITGGTDANYQLFRPSKSILDKVAVGITNATPTEDKIVFKIKKWNGSSWDLVNLSKQLSLSEGWNEYDFGDVEVTTGGRYAIFVNVYTDGLPGWKYSSNGTYANGYTVAQGIDKPYWDANFKTWGYDPSTPPTEPTPESEATTNQDAQQSVLDGGAPPTNTSPSIQKPTNLNASYESTSGVKLTWTASTTSDIDGYLVFVSEAQGKDYKQIGQTPKDVVEYLDETVASGKTYYYIVRAYKGSAQSESSNEASITVPASKKESPKNIQSSSGNNYNFFTPIVISGLGLVFILSAVLGYMIYRRKRMAKGKKESSSPKIQFGDSSRGERLETGESSVRRDEDGAKDNNGN